MPQLIKNIQGSVQPYITGNVFYTSSISGIIQEEDYINLYGFIGFLQNLKQTEYTSALTVPLMFGLPNFDNIPMVTIQIDY
tara:strand:- start:46135 stop:46377 length:243 start_codon:yes stop_codon:yes gene_type:complete